MITMNKIIPYITFLVFIVSGYVALLVDELAIPMGLLCGASAYLLINWSS